MAIVSKTTRCAVCGSTDVTFSEATKHYHCASCGADNGKARMIAWARENLPRKFMVGVREMIQFLIWKRNGSQAL